MTNILIEEMYNWMYGPSLIVYVACKMSGRDKVEMVERAKYVIQALATYNIRAISPVLEENVSGTGILSNPGDLLKQYWKRDKDIIRYISHAVILDQAEMMSFGMAREYSLNRGVLWKPTVMVLKSDVPVSVAQFEDDLICHSIHAAAARMSLLWGSRYKRITWRLKMISRSLPKFLLGQLYGFR